MVVTELVGMLLTEGPRRLPLRAPWTLHQCLAELAATAEGRGAAHGLPGMAFEADATVGMAAPDAARAIDELLSQGVLRLEGTGWDATLEVDDAQLRTYRRLLMGSDPELADLIYRAGRNWAALALTAEKNWNTACASVEVRRKSGTPKRRQGPLAPVR
jgi:hypothetical protein